MSEERDKLEEILHMVDKLTYDELIKLRDILIKEAGTDNN